jgi:pyruvate,water dikinase
LKDIFKEKYNNIIYAIRSSSPEEDLEGASFAGNYETYLGIKYEDIEKYILKTFLFRLSSI